MDKADGVRQLVFEQLLHGYWPNKLNDLINWKFVNVLL